MQNIFLFFFILLNLFSSISCICQSETSVISNLFKGKIVGLGYNYGGNGIESQTNRKVFFDCSNCQEIGNAYIIALEINVNNNPVDTLSNRNVFVNNSNITFNENTRIGGKMTFDNFPKYAYLHFQQFNFSCGINDSIYFSISPQELFHSITGFYILFECLDNTSSSTKYELVLNTFSQTDLTYFSNNSLEFESLDYTKDVGFALFGMIMNFMDGDATEVIINDNYIGKIAGIDMSSSNQFPIQPGVGVRGHFSYWNGQLVGLDDDVANTTVDSTDAIAIINSYLTGNQVTFECKHETPFNLTNPVQGVTFVYTSNCDVFDYEVSQDTTICPNIPLQLTVSGGTRYEWQPATGLSCTDCPNPIATLDSSQLYTVRIWNNDSCSVVRPVKVNVRDLPRFQSINPTATVCGLATGNVVAVAQNSTSLPVSYSLNGAAFQPSSTFTEQFSNIEAGEYTLSLQDGFGCQRDTVFSIGSNNTTQAQFTASPQSGAAPLTVSFTNTSVNATDVEWFINGESQGASFSTFTFDTSGVYTVTLVAWQNSPSCADTFSLQISVFDTLILQIPNVFTPNNDGVNDFFSITSNLPLNFESVIINRWGTVVASKKSTFAPNAPEFLWDGKNATDGTYFYTLEVEWENETKKVEGFVVKIGD